MISSTGLAKKRYAIVAAENVNTVRKVVIMIIGCGSFGINSDPKKAIVAKSIMYRKAARARTKGSLIPRTTLRMASKLHSGPIVP